jgi:hypothetical protein
MAEPSFSPLRRVVVTALSRPAREDEHSIDWALYTLREATPFSLDSHDTAAGVLILRVPVSVDLRTLQDRLGRNFSVANEEPLDD